MTRRSWAGTTTRTTTSSSSRYGYISEHHAFGQNERIAGDYAEDLAASMLATVLDLPFKPEEAWDARREEWRLSGLVVTSQNHTAVAEAPEDGSWVTALSAAVLCG